MKIYTDLGQHGLRQQPVQELDFKLNEPQSLIDISFTLFIVEKNSLNSK